MKTFIVSCPVIWNNDVSNIMLVILKFYLLCGHFIKSESWPVVDFSPT